MNMYPNVDIDKKSWPLQSLLFGHRIQPSQTKYEYLIEFLQVAIAEKQSGNKNAPTFTAMFPVEEAPDGNFRYFPRLANELLIAQPDCGEQALDIADELIRSAAVDLVVIDSVAALTPKAEIEGDMGDNRVGLQARLMSQALRKLTATINKTNTTCIFINQLREKIGVMFGNPETTTGGNALKFYASVRLDIRKASQIKEGDEVIGNQVRVKVVKNKVAPPFKKTEFDLMFNEGISRVGELVDMGTEYGILTKSGSWYSYDGNKLAQGRDAVKNVLRDNPDLAEEIENKIMEALKK